MDFRLSESSATPLYRQLVDQIRYAIVSGKMRDGDELPAIRVLAERLRINPNTVARAYREFEAVGLVDKRSTAGTYVSSRGSPLTRRAKAELLHQRIDQLLAEAQALGFSLQQLQDAVDARHRRLERLRAV